MSDIFDPEVEQTPTADSFDAPPPLPEPLEEIFDEPETVEEVPYFEPEPVEPEPIPDPFAYPEPEPFSTPTAPPPPPISPSAAAAATPAKKNNTVLIIVIVVAVLLVLCCCCMLAMLFMLPWEDIIWELENLSIMQRLFILPSL